MAAAAVGRRGSRANVASSIPPSARLPLRPTAAAVTHLDEVHDWGQVAEWLIHVDLPVQIVSEGPEVPDGARAFSLRWFVEDVMDL